MTQPPQPPPGGKPEQNVGPNGGHPYDILIKSIDGLQRTENNLLMFLERQADATARYAQPGMSALPQMRQSAINMVAQYGGLTGRMTGPNPMQRSWGALSSMQNLQEYTAQRLGQWVAGMPMFDQPGGGGQAPAGAGGTPAGTPSSAQAPAGSGAQAVQAAAAAQGAQGAQGAAQAPPGGAGTLAGLPSLMARATGGRAGPGAVTAMQLAGSRIAMSGGSAGGIVDALRGLPGVGLIADLFEKGTSFFQGQWEKGRAFQEIEGGSNLAAQAERLNQAGYQATMAFTPLGMAGAARAFGGVTALGYNRAAGNFQGQGNAATGGAGFGTAFAQDRGGALNFVYEQYKQAGATIADSLETLKIASQDSSINLKDLSTTLRNVSDTAGQAGVNAEQMRQSFRTAFATALGAGAGAAAPGEAGAVTAMGAGYGRAFQGVSFAGELGPGRNYIVAGLTGLTPAQAQFQQRFQRPQYLKALAAGNMQIISQLPGMTPDALSDMQNMISQAGGAQAIKRSPDLARSIADNWLYKWQVPGQIDLNAWVQIIQSMTGVKGLTDNTVVMWVVQQVAGNNEASQQAGGGGAGTATGTRSGAATVPANRAGSQTAATGRYGLAQGTAPQLQSGRGGALGLSTPGQSWQQVLTAHAGTAAQAYLSEEKKSRQRSPVLEALLQNVGANDRVEVQTRSGPRVMSMTDAMKFYPDELMQGSAMVWSPDGKKVLGTTQQITGLSAQESKGIAAEERGAAGSNRGVSAGQWQRSHPGSVTTAGGGSQKVQIELSTEARQLLKMLPTNYDQASASGTVPAVPWPSTASR